MKMLLILILLTFTNAIFAFERKGPCANTAAQTALKYAAKFWGSTEQAQRILFSILSPSSNPAPVQMYDVGIIRQDNRLVQFNVGLDYVGGKCKNIEVRFAEYVE